MLGWGHPPRHFCVRINNDLQSLKERFLDIFSLRQFSDARNALMNWIEEAHCSGIKYFEKCAQTFTNWLHEILNSFRYPFISNGPTEGLITRSRC